MFRPVHTPTHPPLSPLDTILAHLFVQDNPFLDIPPSPSDTCSSVSTDMSPSPAPHPVRVVCNVPLLAPRPLPYHSPTFLQFDLPDTDEDLSHPPYTHRPPKRKRDMSDPAGQPQSKRRTGTQPRRSHVPHRPWRPVSPVHLSHRSGNHRSRS